MAELAARWPVRVYAPGNRSIWCHPPSVGGRCIEVLGQPYGSWPFPGIRGHLATLARDGCAVLQRHPVRCGLRPAVRSTPAQMSASLASIAALPDTTRIYCAHEYTEMNLRFAVAVEPENAALQTRVARVAGCVPPACQRAKHPGREKATIPSCVAEPADLSQRRCVRGAGSGRSPSLRRSVAGGNNFTGFFSGAGGRRSFPAYRARARC